MTIKTSNIKSFDPGSRSLRSLGRDDDKIKLIILDRDGVINFDSPDYIKSPEEWHAIPGSLEAIAILNKAGFKVAVATNQSGVGRGYYDLVMLERIHRKMHAELEKVGGHLDALFFCPHHPDANCTCRKPKPGLLIQISEYLGIPLNQAIMIGDSPRDIEAAKAAGAKSILIGKEFPDLATAIHQLHLIT